MLGLRSPILPALFFAVLFESDEPGNCRAIDNSFSYQSTPPAGIGTSEFEIDLLLFYLRSICVFFIVAERVSPRISPQQHGKWNKWLEPRCTSTVVFVLSPVRGVRAPCDAYERTVYSTVCRVPRPVGSCCGCGCATPSSTLEATARSPASDAWVGAVVAACPPSAAPSSDDISAGATWGYLV